MKFSRTEGLIIAAIVLIIVEFGWGAYSDSKRQNITLQTDEWQCTKSETRKLFQPLGKLIVPRTKQVCVEYMRIDG